jgi:FixJ family two-component response regulator
MSAHETTYRLPPHAAKRLAELQAIRDGLKPKERQVLDFVFADGLLNRSIARKMKCSVRAVEGYRAAIVQKFGAETMNQVGALYGAWCTLSMLSVTAEPEGVNRGN